MMKYPSPHSRNKWKWRLISCTYIFNYKKSNKFFKVINKGKIDSAAVPYKEIKELSMTQFLNVDQPSTSVTEGNLPLAEKKILFFTIFFLVY